MSASCLAVLDTELNAVARVKRVLEAVFAILALIFSVGVSNPPQSFGDGSD